MSNQNGFNSDEEENYWLEIEQQKEAERQAEEDYFYQQSLEDEKEEKEGVSNGKN